MHRVIPQSQGQNLEIKFSKNSTDNLLRLYNNSISRSSRHNNLIMMQSIQQFILVCNSNNLSNNIHDGQSARGPALPLCSLALPSHFLALPSHSLALTVLPRTPLHAPSHSLARSLALPLALPLHSLPHPRTCRFYVPTAHSHPAPLSACPRCVLTCHGHMSQVG